jgi:hypothetical protein
MDLTRPRKSDAALVLIGITIFILLVLGVVFVIRRQPEVPRQPGASGMARIAANGSVLNVRFRTTCPATAHLRLEGLRDSALTCFDS